MKPFGCLNLHASSVSATELGKVYPRPRTPEMSAVLASMILWGGIPDCQSGRNTLLEPNRSPFFGVQGNRARQGGGCPGRGHSRRYGRPVVLRGTHNSLIERCLSPITLLGQEPEMSRAHSSVIPAVVKARIAADCSTLSNSGGCQLRNSS